MLVPVVVVVTAIIMIAVIAVAPRRDAKSFILGVVEVEDVGIVEVGALG